MEQFRKENICKWQRKSAGDIQLQKIRSSCPSVGNCFLLRSSFLRNFVFFQYYVHSIGSKNSVDMILETVIVSFAAVILHAGAIRNRIHNHMNVQTLRICVACPDYLVGIAIVCRYLICNVFRIIQTEFLVW